MPFAPPLLATVEEDITEDNAFVDDPAWRRGIWTVTKAQLATLTAYDNSLLGLTPKVPLPLVARLFVAYSEMVKRLDWIWNMTFQYQKNQAIRKFVDAATTRLVELKDALADLDVTEYHYIDNELIELKLVPRDLELMPLSAYPVERAAQLQELAERLYKGERIYVDPDAVVEPEEVEEVVEVVPEKVEEDIEIHFGRPVVEKVHDPFQDERGRTLVLIQQHERARVGRLEFLDDKTIYIMRRTADRPKIKKDIAAAAAVNIQKLYRGYRTRRDEKKRYYRRRMLLSMDVPSWRDTTMQDNLKNLELLKKKCREEKIQDYIDTCLKEKERVLRAVGPGLMEDISDEIRWWFRYWYDVALAFDKYPSEKEGGTILVVRGDTMTPQEYRIEQERKRKLKEQMLKNPGLQKKMEAEAERKRKKAADEKKKEKKRKKLEKAEAKRKAKLGIFDPFSFKPGPAHEKMISANRDFALNWSANDEELAGDHDKLVTGRITEDVCYEVQLELRKIVDEMMRLELEQLVMALERDRTGKDPKPKKPPKAKKGKKGKKDPTGKKTTEELFQELYDNGVIRSYPETYLDDFVGDYAYCNLDIRALDLDPNPSVGEAKQLAVNNCIIPLGGEGIPKPKSVLIAGPRQCGKKTLVYAICTATSAVLFDISPTVTATIYPGKKGLRMLTHLINKMSRILQPSVIFINGAEKIFYNKIPNEEKATDPKKLKGALMKEIVKPIKPVDRVMLIGTTNQPWAAGAAMLKVYERFIMIPRTDYGTLYQLWYDTLMKYHGVLRDMDVSSLAKMTIGYPVPYVRKMIQAVLSPRRIIRLKYEPLSQHELLEGLMRGPEPEPVTPEEQDKFNQWYTKKTKMGKKRAQILAPLRQERLDIAAKQKKIDDALRGKAFKKELEAAKKAAAKMK